MGHLHSNTMKVCLCVCGGSLTSGQLFTGSFQTDTMKGIEEGYYETGGVFVKLKEIRNLLDATKQAN